MQLSKLPPKLLNKLPYELWLMIDKYSISNFLNTKLEIIRPKLHLYKITNIDTLPCQNFVYRNDTFEWKIKYYIDDLDIITTFGVMLFKKRVVCKFDTVEMLSEYWSYWLYC